ncbi:hypothetical protein HAX54_046346, partial [Datura stramonium]|nr:hypothetical protein [Datura stramonium]
GGMLVSVVGATGVQSHIREVGSNNDIYTRGAADKGVSWMRIRVGQPISHWALLRCGIVIVLSGENGYE